MISLDGLTQMDYEQCIEDPFDACMKVGKFGSGPLKKWKKNAAEREAGKFLEAKILWLEGELLDKTNKLTCVCDTLLVEMQEERDKGV